MSERHAWMGQTCWGLQSSRHPESGAGLVELHFHTVGGTRAPWPAPDITNVAICPTHAQAASHPSFRPTRVSTFRLVQKHPALTRTFDDAKPEIQRRLLQEGRQQRIEAWAQEMRAKQKVEVFEERLKDVKVSGAPHAPVPARPAGNPAVAP